MATFSNEYLTNSALPTLDEIFLMDNGISDVAKDMLCEYHKLDKDDVIVDFINSKIKNVKMDNYNVTATANRANAIYDFLVWCVDLHLDVSTCIKNFIKNLKDYIRSLNSSSIGLAGKTAQKVKIEPLWDKVKELRIRQNNILGIVDNECEETYTPSTIDYSNSEEDESKKPWYQQERYQNI